jgi:hypothetical protein
MLGVYIGTGTASKIDAYTTRSMDYVVDVDPATGAVHGRMDVSITNDAPADAPEYVLGLADLSFSLVEDRELPLGDNVLLMSIYSRSTVSALEGEDGAITDSRDTLPALGYDRSAIALEVPLGETVHVTFETDIQVEPGRYDLVVMAQQTAVIGELTVTVRPAPGWRVVGDGVAPDGSWTSASALDLSRAFTLLFERVG